MPVEHADAFLGLVEGVRFVSSIDRPDVLEVRGGRLGRRLWLIPTALVERVVVDEERVVLREGAMGVRRSPLLRLRVELGRLRDPAAGTRS